MFKKRLADFTAPEKKIADDQPEFKHSLSGDYEMWRVARFLFAEVLRFKILDQPMEKINWAIPFEYKSQYKCYISHEKFGFRIYLRAPTEDEATQVAKEIEKVLYETLMSLRPLLEQYATEALAKGEVIVENKYSELYEVYAYFKKQTLRRRRKIQKPVSKNTFHKPFYDAMKQHKYYEGATYIAFFSLLEHLSILFLGFKDIPSRSEIEKFAKKKWHEKFKLIFDITEPAMLKTYESLFGIAAYQRNQSAHGYPKTTFEFYLEGARHKIPVALTEKHIMLRWGNQETNFASMDSFLKLLRRNKTTRNVFEYIHSGLNVSFFKDSLAENDAINIFTKNDLNGYLEHQQMMSDNMGNMDW